MKSLVIKIISVIMTISAIFIAGSRTGKSKEQNNQLKRTVKNVRKVKDIENNTVKLSRSDKLDRL